MRELALMLARLAHYYAHILSLSLIFLTSSGFLASAIFPTTIETWLGLAVLALLIALFIVYRYAPRESNLSEKYSWAARLIGFLPYLILLPAFLVVLQHDSLQVSLHGDLHTAYITQILTGQGQPENIYLAGAPANYYWLYHATVATLSRALWIPPTSAWLVLNGAVLIATLILIDQTLKLILPRPYAPFLQACCVLFCLFGLNLFGFLHSMVDLWEAFRIQDIFTLIAPLAFYDSARLATLFGKYTNFTSFPLALLYAWWSLYLAIKGFKGRWSAYDLLLFLLSIAGGTIFLLMGGLFMIAALLSGGVLTWLIVSFWYRQWQFQALWKWLKSSVFHPLVALVGLLILAMTAVYMLGSLGALVGSQSSSLSFQPLRLTMLTALFSSFYPLLPFLLIAFFIAWREQNQLLLFLLMIGLMESGAAQVIALTDGNEYKFVHLAAFPFSLAVVLILERFTIHLETSQGQVNYRLSHLLILLFSACISLNILGYAAQLQSSAKELHLEREGMSVMDSAHPYKDVFAWLRVESPLDSLLILPTNETAYVPLYSERQVLVMEAYYELAPAYAESIRAVHDLLQLDPQTSEWQAALNHLKTLAANRPLLLLVPTTAPLATYDLSAYEKLFEGQSARLYRLN